MTRQAFRPSDSNDAAQYSVLSVRAIVVWALLIVLVGAGVAMWLLLAYTSGDTEANRVQLEAIRTAGTVVVGTGGAAALLLAARRQRSAEIALKQKERDQADVARAHTLQQQVADQTRQHQERVAAASEADAEARRITDLYTKAVEQLGSDKAPVRLGGLYALERLAQDNAQQRQTIVSVLCAYLRMPYTPPDNQPSNADTDEKARVDDRERVQEREVRLTAQRLLADHLRPGTDPTSPVDTYWADMDIDLTHATLINFTLYDCTVRTAYFGSTSFNGHTNFRSFKGHALFGWATFAGPAYFEAAIFTGHADFASVTFSRSVDFNGVTFSGTASFASATFAHGVPEGLQRFWSPPPDGAVSTDTAERDDIGS